MIFQIILMYIILSSLCLIFEISLKKLYFFSENHKTILFSSLKTVVVVMLTILISFFILKYVLIRFNMTFILPFLILVLILAISIVFEIINKDLFTSTTSDYILCFISAYIASSEGTSLPISLLVSATSVSCYYIILYILFCVDKRNSTVIKATNSNTIPLLLLTLAIIILASFSWDVSWLSIRFF